MDYYHETFGTNAKVVVLVDELAYAVEHGDAADVEYVAKELQTAISRFIDGQRAVQKRWAPKTNKWDQYIYALADAVDWCDMDGAYTLVTDFISDYQVAVSLERAR